MREESHQLIDMVKRGTPDKEIMEHLGIQTKASLKKMYYDALVESGKIKDIATKEKVETSKTLKVGKRGAITLSRALVIDKFGFDEGDTFTVSKRRDSIILRKQ
jgi:hypothetical protein